MNHRSILFLGSALIFAAGCESEQLGSLRGKIAVEPAALTLHAVRYGEAVGTATITNLGPGVLTIDRVGLSEDTHLFFEVRGSVLSYPLVLAASENTRAYVHFTPTLAGEFHGAMRVRSDDAEKPDLRLEIAGFAEERECVDCCTEGQTRSCTPNAQMPLVGACHAGTETCQSDRHWSACQGFVAPHSEICDNAIDEDCDGTADDGCLPDPDPPDPMLPVAELIPLPEIEPNRCGSAILLPSTCEMFTPSRPADQLLAATSLCQQPMPPAGEPPPCEVSQPGTKYYVSESTGSDSNDGLSPMTPWASLCNAVAAVPDNSTILVAEGTYANVWLGVDRPISVVGGYDLAFSEWSAKNHPSYFLGRLTMSHGAAVFAGFYMLSDEQEIGWPGMFHQIAAGSLVRNYIQVRDIDVEYFLYAVVASPCEGGGTIVACNDIYVHQNTPVDGVEYGNTALPEGEAYLLANRICIDTRAWVTTAVAGYGTCPPVTSTSRLVFANNVIEGHNGMEFYGCGEDLDLAVANNTIFAGDDGLSGYEGSAGGTVRWKVANNIVVGDRTGRAVELGMGRVEISESYNNLTFNFQSNLMHPSPIISLGDDTSNVPTRASVFAGPADFMPLAGGEADGTGKNLFGDPNYGALTHDLNGFPRSATAAWDRGAYELP